jgi:phenylpropionate dioxygenase-like ring-hydroxylating dioxygenase large terminal subunit
LDPKLTVYTCPHTQQVTVFDVDFVVAKISENEVIAMEDRCPHKAAALSEGRVTSSGNIQCAYHGWTFDGKTGNCVDIPQVSSLRDVDHDHHQQGTENGSDAVKSKPTFPARSCSKAVPALIHQEMTYIFWGTAEEALVAPPPPSIPEYGEEGFHVSSSVRDMPVDWPIVVSNICDADHGLFAHQAKAFDMYAASKDIPMAVSQDFPDDGKSWTVHTKVDAGPKLNEIDRLRRLNGSDNKRTKEKQTRGGDPALFTLVKQKKVEESPWATTYFEAPYHLQMKRVDKKTNKTNFITTFYICPTGVGRTRFMGGALGRKIPRWVIKLGLDNFLDQDTYLLATQQHHILSQEAKDVRDMLNEATGLTLEDKINSIRSEPMPTRRKLFCLSSPTDAFGAKLERFWDATLLRSPNRITNLLKLDDAGFFLQTPPRSVVLDRKKQVLDVSPEHQAVVRNCKTIQKYAVATSIVTVMAKVLAKTIFMSNGLASTIHTILNPSVLLLILGASAVMSSVAGKIVREYYFKYTEEYRRKDMDKIPKVIWKDV